jgi:hypothetical protein
MEEGSAKLLNVEQAGAALFLTALARRSGQSRILAVLSTHETQTARLALGMRSAGLHPDDIHSHFARIHPRLELHRNLGEITPVEASRWLEDASSVWSARQW